MVQFSDWLAQAGRQPDMLGWRPMRWLAENAAHDPRWPRGVGYAGVRRHLVANGVTDTTLDALARASRLYMEMQSVLRRDVDHELEDNGYDDSDD